MGQFALVRLSSMTYSASGESRWAYLNNLRFEHIRCAHFLLPYEIAIVVEPERDSDKETRLPDKAH